MMRSRQIKACSRRLTALLAIAVASLAVLTCRADAAMYWANGQTIAGANADGSNLDLNYISEASSGDILHACGVAVNDQYIYWATYGLDRISRANLDGTQPDFSFIVGADQPCGVAVDAAHLYWANTGGESIGRANLDGTAPDQRFIGGIMEPCGVTVHGYFIYWGSPREDSIGRSLVFGDDLHDNQFIEGAAGACGVAADETHLYWGSFYSSIGRAELDD